jgi:2-oxoglutarate ferredoxin oxidoreductase subunit beta
LLDKLIEKALVKRGFGVVEVITHCHTQYGRRNRMGDAVAMMKWQKEHAVRVEKAADLSEEELRDKFTIGVLADRELPIYTEQYELVREQATKNLPRQSRH